MGNAQRIQKGTALTCGVGYYQMDQKMNTKLSEQQRDLPLKFRILTTEIQAYELC